MKFEKKKPVFRWRTTSACHTVFLYDDTSSSAAAADRRDQQVQAGSFPVALKSKYLSRNQVRAVETSLMSLKKQLAVRTSDDDEE